MADFDMTANTREGLGETRVLRKTFDASVQNLAQNDIAQLIDVPANSFVHAVRWEVTTVEGAARNFALGDGADTDGYVATTTGNTLAEGCSAPPTLTEGAPNTITGLTGGKYYAAADTIDLLAVTSGGLTAMVIDVAVVITEFGA